MTDFIEATGARYETSGSVIYRTETSVTASTATLLAYFKAISGQKVLSGQHAYDALGGTQLQQINQIIAATGQAPAIVGVFLSRPFSSFDESQSVATANYWLSQGGLVFVSIVPGNPSLGPVMEPGASPSTTVNFANILIPATTEYNNWQTYLAQLVTIFKSINGPVLFRPFPEVNETWGWWQSQDPGTFITIWQQMHAYLATNGVNNVLWVYNVGSDESNNTTYLATGYVDILSLDAYPPNPGNFAHVIGQFQQLGYPVMYAEMGMTPGSPTFFGDNSQLLATVQTFSPSVFAVVVWDDNDALPNQNGMGAFMSNPKIVNRSGLPH